MAYFSNGTEGMVFDEQCAKCRHGDKPCPIALIQAGFNYKAPTGSVQREILDRLVHQNGDCAMYLMDPMTFKAPDAEQVDMFECPEYN